MDSLSSDGLHGLGFVGFQTVGALRGTSCLNVPSAGGVYIVLTPDRKPRFLELGTGGRFKGQNPNVAIETLSAKWVDGAETLYIGRSVDLHRRVRTLVRFGAGSPVAHWGGRYLWQLEDSEDLLVCWLPDLDPEALERKLIQMFRTDFGGRLPFANLRQ